MLYYIEIIEKDKNLFVIETMSNESGESREQILSYLKYIKENQKIIDDLLKGTSEELKELIAIDPNEKIKLKIHFDEQQIRNQCVYMYIYNRINSNF